VGTGSSLLWAAEDPDDETKSTHLWIFNRAVDLILGDAGLREKNPELAHFLYDQEFVKGVHQGIYEADYPAGGMYFGYYSSGGTGMPFLAHFYNPILKTSYAGIGDKLFSPKWNPITFIFSEKTRYEIDEVNALKFGLYFLLLSSSTNEGKQASGKYLGLAIHYLEDLTQPMHSGLFINLPDDYPGYRHGNYENWTMIIQEKARIPKDLLKLDDFKGFKKQDFYELAANRSFDVFKTWYDKSPIGGTPIGVDQPAKEGPGSHYIDSVFLATVQMLQLAQRLVAGLLLTWNPPVQFSNPAARHGVRYLPFAKQPARVAIDPYGTVYVQSRDNILYRNRFDEGKRIWDWVFKWSYLHTKGIVAIDPDNALALVAQVKDEPPIQLVFITKMATPGLGDEDGIRMKWRINQSGFEVQPIVSIDAACIGPRSFFVAFENPEEKDTWVIWSYPKENLFQLPKLCETQAINSLSYARWTITTQVGPLISMAAGPDSTGLGEDLWATNAAYHIWRAGDPWVGDSKTLRGAELPPLSSVESGLRKVVVQPAPKPAIIGLNQSGEIYRYMGSPNWDRIGVGFTDIALNNNGELWTINNESVLNVYDDVMNMRKV
jgi:hypothetical protein